MHWFSTDLGPATFLRRNKIFQVFNQNSWKKYISFQVPSNTGLSCTVTKTILLKPLELEESMGSAGVCIQHLLPKASVLFTAHSKERQGADLPRPRKAPAHLLHQPESHSIPSVALFFPPQNPLYSFKRNSQKSDLNTHRHK